MSRVWNENISRNKGVKMVICKGGCSKWYRVFSYSLPAVLKLLLGDRHEES
jgi:hypothetical protein